MIGGERVNIANIQPFITLASLAVSSVSLSLSYTSMARQWPAGFQRVNAAVTAALGSMAVASAGLIYAVSPHGPTLTLQDGVLIACVALGMALTGIGIRRFQHAPVDRNSAHLRGLASEVISSIDSLQKAAAMQPRTLVDLQTYEDASTKPSLSLARSIREAREIVSAVAGPAGSGKSTALQEVAVSVCRDAARSRSPKTIAVYVDFATMLASAEAPSSEAIRAHVLESIAGSDTALREKLTASLRGDSDAATWIFLFDSVDELAASWPADSVDVQMRKLFEEIRRFVRPGDLRFRAVVAMRDTFPVPQGTVTMSIAPLSPRQQHRLMMAAGLNSTAHLRALERLRYVAADIPARPLALQLWQENLARPPGSQIAMSVEADTVFDVMAETVFARLETVVHDPTENKTAQDIATEIAAAIINWKGPTTIPQRDELVASVSRSLGVSKSEVLSAVEHLESAKLIASRRLHSISFSHRSFHDFFAARWLIANFQSFPIRLALTELRWREAASAALRVGPDQLRSAFFVAAQELVRELTFGLLPSADEFVRIAPSEPLPVLVGAASPDARDPMLLYVLSLVNSIPVSKLGMLPSGLRSAADRFVATAFIRDSRMEQREALGVMKIMSPPVAVRAAERAILRGGLLLEAAASAWETTMRPVQDLDTEARCMLAWGLAQQPTVIREVARRPSDSLAGGVATLGRDLVTAGRVSALILLAFAFAGTISAFRGGNSSGGCFLLIISFAAALFVFRTLPLTHRPNGWPDFASGIVVLLWIGLSAFLAIVAVPILLFTAVAEADNLIGALIRSYVVSWPASIIGLLLIGDSPTRQDWLFPQAYLVRPLYRYVRRVGVSRRWRIGATGKSIALGIVVILLSGSAPLPTALRSNQDARAILVIGMVVLWVMLAWAASIARRFSDRRILFTSSATGDLDSALLLERIRLAGSSDARLQRLMMWLRKVPPANLVNAQEALTDLARVFDYVERMVPASTKTRIPRGVWDVGPPFGLTTFRQWIEDFDAVYPGKLGWLAVQHGDAISRLVSRGSSAMLGRDSTDRPNADGDVAGPSAGNDRGQNVRSREEGPAVEQPDQATLPPAPA